VIAWFMLAASAATPVSDSAEADAAVAASSPVIERRLPDFDPGRTGFTVTAGPDLEIGYSEFTLFVHPGERLDLVANTPVRWHEGEAAETQDAVLAFDWLAPETPGHHTLTLTSEAGETMQLNLVVMHRHEAGDDHINGYRIGAYPAEPYRGQDNYRAPEYFVEVSPGIADLPLSPHFRLGQFLCKQESGDGPAYLVVSERLVLKLEKILEAANDRGWSADTFTVMSGYRTPAYNAGLGNAEHSRHIYGGAADIYIDSDGDGVMDDLNGDGQHDRRDAAVLYDLVDSMASTQEGRWQVGGLGEYGPNAYHGAFVHVDERGWRARWGRS
jgi:hypothetical protein